MKTHVICYHFCYLTKNSQIKLLDINKVKKLEAETKGFEPLIPLQVYTLSRRAPSTTRTSLHF